MKTWRRGRSFQAASDVLSSVAFAKLNNFLTKGIAQANMHGRVDFSAELILVCNSLDAGGIERVVSTLANEWSHRGRKVCVVTLHDRQRFYALDPAIHHVIIDRAGITRLGDLVRWLAARIYALNLHQVPVFEFIGRCFRRLLWKTLNGVYYWLLFAYESISLRRALKRVESPVVVALGTPINIIAIKACRGLGRRVVISERNDPKRLPNIKNWDSLARRFYNHADLVTANTRGALRDMSEYVEPAKLAFVPNPLKIMNGNGHGNPPAAAASPFILIVARLVSDKAHDVLLEAFALLCEELKEWRLAVVGDGRLKPELYAQAENLGIAGRVDWHGIVPDPHAFYRRASIFALPSRVEGTPNALLEAMNWGLPVIVSDGAPGPLELVKDEVTGLVVPVNDPARLAAALRRLGNDGALRQRLGAAARERVTEYDLPRALATWESVVGLC
jgi:glycosyltransferase involved in cell wall biosynthesis